MVLCGIVLYANEYNHTRMEPLAHLIGEVSIKHNVPITYAATGKTWEALHHCQPQIVDHIQQTFAAHTDGFWPGDKPEAITSTEYATAIANPYIPEDRLHLWHEQFLSEIAGRPRAVLDGLYGRSPQGFFPPEMIFSLAQAHKLKQLGFNYAIIGGEVLSDDEPKGHVWYPGNGEFNAAHHLKLLIRENNIALQKATTPYNLKEEIKNKAQENGGIIIVGCDLPIFTGKYHDEGRGGHPRNNGIDQLIGLAQELHADPETTLWNANAIANSYWHPRNFLEYLQSREFENPWHFIFSWMNAQGDLSDAKSEVFREDAELVSNYSENREAWYPGSGMENRMDWN